MRALFFGRKSLALRALDYLLECGWDVLPVVPRRDEPSWMPVPQFREGLIQRNVPFVTHRDLNRYLLHGEGTQLLADFLSKPADFVLSYLFPELILAPVISLPRIAAVNFHPAPLPQHGGLGGYSFAILERDPNYGVSVHHLDSTFDTGDLVFTKQFEYDPDTATALELESACRPYLFQAFVEFVELAESGRPIPRIPQTKTRYVTKEERDAAKLIDPLRDSPEVVERKARAFWYPPYDGATITIGDRALTIVPPAALHELKSLHRAEFGAKYSFGQRPLRRAFAAAVGLPASRESRPQRSPADAEATGPEPVTNHSSRAAPSYSAKTVQEAASAESTGTGDRQVRATLAATVNQILEESERAPILRLTDDMHIFNDIGFDSLDLAQLVVLLEQKLSIDPFRSHGAAVRTFGDLVGAYERIVQ